MRLGFLTSTKITYGVKDVVSAETDFGKVADSLKGDGTIGDDGGNIYYYVTQFLEKALKDLREHDTSYRIVIFIDDLDRCSPDRSLEVLESIKSFFDIEGIVYVVGMDSETINTLIKKKYGEESAVKGLDYLQKIVQLPFHIPTWEETDMLSSISKIISKGLEGSKLAEDFENNKSLIVKAVELNPRQVKRFINNIILAESVFDKPVDELIAVQALNFRQEWRKFLDLITHNDDRRKMFFNEYKKIKEEGKVVTTEAELDKLIEQTSENNHPLLKDVTDIYRELVKQDYSLRDFLDAGAQEVLERIKKMEEHRRALDTAKLPPSIEEEQQQISSKTVLISYALEDAKFAERFSQDLKSAGLTPWIAKDAIRAGENWKIAIRKAIKISRYFIPLFSSNSERIGYTQAEFKYAIDNYDKFPESEIYIIPARLDDCQIPYEKLEDIQYVDLFPDWDKGISQIFETIGFMPQWSRKS